MKLQSFLVRLIACCLLPLLLLGCWLAVRHVQMVRDEQGRHVEQFTRNAAVVVDQFLSARLDALQALSSTAHPSTVAGSVSADGQQGSDPLALDGAGVPVYRVATPSSSAALGVTAEGRSGFPSGPSAIRFQSGAGLPAEVLAAARQAVRSKRPGVGDPFDDPVARTRTVALAAPGLRQGRVEFVLVAFLPLREVEARLALLARPEPWVVNLRDSNGQMLSVEHASAKVEDAVLHIAQAHAALAPWAVTVQTSDTERFSEITRTAAVMLLAVVAATAASILGGRWAAARLAHSVASLVDTQQSEPWPLDIQEVSAARSRIDRAVLDVQVRDAQLRAIFDSASEAIVTVDPTQRIVMANAAAARMFGHPLETLVGMSLDALLPQRFRERHRADVTAFGQTDPLPRPMGRRPDVVGLRADGEEFPAEAAISHVHVDGRRLSTAILRDITERRKVEQALRESAAQIEASHADLQHLVAAQDSIQEMERARVARELHDDLQQTLAAILMEVTAARDGGEGVGQKAHEALDRIDALSTAAIASTRRIIQDLRPQMLEELGLVPALKQLAAQFTERTGVVCDVNDAGLAPGAEDRLAPVATCLYRVTQEALNNVVKHSGARRVRLRLSTWPPDGLTLSIADDGIGLAAAAPRRAGSFGLLGMGERVRAVGGHLDVHGEPGTGTTVEVRLEHLPSGPRRASSCAS